jgi:hypothetical protein
MIELPVVPVTCATMGALVASPNPIARTVFLMNAPVSIHRHQLQYRDPFVRSTT